MLQFQVISKQRKPPEIIEGHRLLIQNFLSVLITADTVKHNFIQH